MQRFVETEYDRKMLIRFLENEKLPFSASTSRGGQRSNKQNRLQRLWMNEIAEQRGDMSPEEVRGYCKLTIGVPILRSENEDFCKRYDEVVKPMPYEQKLAIMMEPLDLPVTRLMTTRQHAAYLDGIQRHFAEQGIVLTSPDTYGLDFATGEDQSQSRDAPADSGGVTSEPSSAAASNPEAKASEDNGRISAAEGAPMTGEVSRVATGRTVAATSERMDATARRDGHAIPDERAMVNSANSNVTFLKEEMVQKILRLVSEKDVTVDEKVEILDQIKPGWIKDMPGHSVLVDQVFRAAEQIVRGKITSEDGRRLMEAL